MKTWDRTTFQAFPSTEVTHLHLLRHGNAETGGVRLAYGHTDIPLSIEGERQTRALVDWARHHLPKPDLVFASDLTRAALLGEQIAQETGARLIVDAGFREQHMGDWEGRSWAALTAEDVVGTRAFWQDYVHATPPGGESLAALAQRVMRTLSKHWPSIVGKRVVLVGHAGVLRTILCWGLDLPLDQALRFSPLPGTHTWLQIAEAGAVVQVLGERPLASDPGAAGAVYSPAAERTTELRIAMAGSAGTGKSTLARRLAQQLDVPYIPEGMRERVEAGLDMHSLNHDGFEHLVFDLWDEQVAREEEAVRTHGGFVSDRSPWDHAAFWLIYRLVSNPAVISRRFAEARARSARLNRIVVLPWGVIPLVGDGVRSANPWTQRLFQSTLEGLVQQEAAENTVAWMPPLVDLDSRLRWMTDLLVESGTAGRRTLPVGI